jgi:hypothetical protein
MSVEEITRTSTTEEKRVSLYCYGHIQQKADEEFTEIISKCVPTEIKKPVK